VRAVEAKQHFSDDILADLRESKGLRVRAGTGPHRFIGIWFVVVNDRVFVRSCRGQGSYRGGGDGLRQSSQHALGREQSRQPDVPELRSGVSRSSLYAGHLGK
jgi:hypothetical protein